MRSLISDEELYGKTGTQIAPINTLYQLYCDKKSGKMEKAKSFLLLPNYLNFLLTGIKKNEYTIATTSGIINAKNRTWDKEIIDLLGFKSELFGEIAMPSELLGEFSDEVCSLVGYKAKIILPATHDTASAVIAAPIEEGAPYISSGTWSLLGVEKARPYTNATALTANYSNEGSPKGYRLQKNIVGLWMIQRVREESAPDYSFEELAEFARTSPSHKTIQVNDQRFLAPKNMTEEIYAALGERLTLGELAYVIYNSLALSYKESLTDLENITETKYETLNIIGGGSRNTLLNELTAKHTGKRIITGPTECTAIGNVMMQMISSGEISDINEGREIVRKSFNISELSQ